MGKQEEIGQITKLFRQLGESDDYAERLAHSQVEKGEPALAKELFLRLAKDSCIWSNDLSSISLSNEATNLDMREKAVNRLLEAGAEKQDALDIIRYTARNASGSF